jgi:hypothetical protein
MHPAWTLFSPCLKNETKKRKAMWRFRRCWNLM